MKTKTKLIAIDREKFKTEFKRRGLTFADASREMGYSVSWLKKHYEDGFTSLAAVKALESRYNMHLDDYRLETPEQGMEGEIQTPEEQLPGQLIFGMPEDVSATKMYQIMYAAMKQAIIDTKKGDDE